MGATSAIAQSVARRLSPAASHAMLMGRNAEQLEQVAEDLRSRGSGQVSTATVDFNDLDRHSSLVDEMWATLGGCDVLLLAYGSLPDQAQCEASAEEALELLRGVSTGAIGDEIERPFGVRLANREVVVLHESGFRH